MADTSPSLVSHAWVPDALRCADVRCDLAFIAINWDLCDRERFTCLSLAGLPTEPLWGQKGVAARSINAVIHSLPCAP